MPSKIQLDENLWFLYICLQKSDYKNIDFNAVGAVTHLKAPAARMRYTRLRRQIESGTLIGTHGTPFQKGGGEGRGKRKRGATGGGELDDEEGVMGREVKAENKSSVDGDDGDAVEERVSSDDETPLAKRTTRIPPLATVGRVLEGARYLTPRTSHIPSLPHWEPPSLDTLRCSQDEGRDMPHSSADSEGHGG
ncbi:hypothetical protein O988_07306 [Pseudogymnoascus sp. VKM F-3808]|nr:hypothetical protein O988_07306 [Pseudogymnoascus sp. VKM F-3808]